MIRTFQRKGEKMKSRLTAFLIFAGTIAFSLSAQAQYGGYVNVNAPISGTFSPQLPMDNTGKPYIDYHFVVQAPGSYQINLTSSDTMNYDPYLILMQGHRRIVEDDDGAGNLNSRIIHFLNPGTYTIRVTRFGTGPVTGYVAFTLSITSSVGYTPPVNTYITPLTDALARVLVNQYYSTQGQFAGQYAINIIRTRMVNTGPTTAEVHVQYHYTCMRSHCSGARSGQDQRIFYFQTIGNSWRVVRMGPHMSAWF